MNTTRSESTERLLRVFPIFAPLPDSWPRPQTILKIHFGTVGLLYGVFIAAAFQWDQLRISGGIGVLENPPFFAHLVATIASVPFLLLLVARLVRSLDDAPQRVRNEFWTTVERTRLVRLVSLLTGFLGLVALAGSMVMASTFQVDIYDSIENVPTFTIYSIIRVYQYLVCYPVIVTAGLVLPWLLFLALRRSSVGYAPFAVDGMGNLKKYLKVFDAPVFAVQTLAVAIALANYVGWAGFKPVSTLLAAGAPLVVTSLAAVLYLSFAALVRSQRNVELQKIVERQNVLYSAMLSDTDSQSRTLGDVAEELEASVRVYDLIRSTRNLGWIKYLANLSIAVMPNILSSEVLSQVMS